MKCIHCDQPIVELLDGTWAHEREGENYSSYCRCKCEACRQYDAARKAGFSRTEAQEVYESFASEQHGTECCDGEEAEPAECVNPMSDPANQRHGAL